MEKIFVQVQGRQGSNDVVTTTVARVPVSGDFISGVANNPLLEVVGVMLHAAIPSKEMPVATAICKVSV